MPDFKEKAMPGLSDKQMEEFRANDKSLREFNDQLIEEFRANGGKVLSGPFVGAPLLLLTTTGAKSGRPTTTPLVYTRDGDRIVIIASKAGAPTNPAWFHNLKAHPVVTIEIGKEKFQARAVITADPERKRLFDAQAKAMPAFVGYQKNTTRQIPVIVLERIKS
jgi:deazaflavin-dependent oxidoreductase (nitroreductase family)